MSYITIWLFHKFSQIYKLFNRPKYFQIWPPYGFGKYVKVFLHQTLIFQWEEIPIPDLEYKIHMYIYFCFAPIPMTSMISDKRILPPKSKPQNWKTSWIWILFVFLCKSFRLEIDKQFTAQLKSHFSFFPSQYNRPYSIS